MLRGILQEPLLHFLILGALLFMLFDGGAQSAGSSDQRIVITPGQIEHLAAGFERTWRRPPSERELSHLISDHVRETVYYREALAMGLDEDDRIVRQRMRQKLEFLATGAADALRPTDEQLRDYLREHAERFTEEPRIAFRQVHLGPAHERDQLEVVAARWLDRLDNGTRPSELVRAGAMATMIPPRVPLVRRSEVERLFGGGFADRIMALEPGAWAGPIESGYGLHLVRVDDRRPARLPDLDTVRNRVTAEWRSDRRARLTDEFYRDLRERYEVIVQSPSGDAAGEASPQ
jgi:hypothetical protein